MLFRAARLAVLLVAGASATAAAADKGPPNIVVIISDDAGYADFSMHGSRRFRTPHIDSIARRGVIFTQGYVTASVCSPSRAGLLTGRYQQRFGHELNIPPRFSEVNGLPTSEVLLAARLRKLGYRTIALGKWHLGYADEFHPLSRGFDDFFGFLQGARSYRVLAGKSRTRLNRLLRDREPVEESFDYMTDELGRQAAAYIEKHHGRPFFLYLAPNAVHTPMHARPDLLDTIEGIRRPRRRKLAAMTVSLDNMVGTVLAALREHGLEQNTLLVFVNDNGGATNNAAVNTPLRGHKGTPFEGGIRVPFVLQWPARVPAGKRYQNPVITLDLVPTALVAAGRRGTLPEELDGVDLLPYITGKTQGRPHQTLYWRKGDNWAVRHGDWKLLGHPATQAAPMLFDLAGDPRERNDRAAEQHEVAAALRKQFRTWAAGLAEPRWRYRRAPKPKGDAARGK